ESAGFDGAASAALVGPVPTATPAGVVDLADDGRVAFRHDLYAEVAYASIPVGLRSVLHTACARRPAAASTVAHHLLAAGTATPALVEAIQEADRSLHNAPGVAADLLDEAAPLAEQDPAAAVRLAYARARALSRSGQFARGIAVAQAALGSATDPALSGDLQRVLMFSLTAQGKSDEVVGMIDTTLGYPIPDEMRRLLGDFRSYIALLGGSEPVPLQPFAPDPLQLSLTGLVAEALRCYLVGETAAGLEYAVHASRRYAGDDMDPHEGSSADIWPAVIEMANEGPIAAAEHLRESERLRAERGNTWLTPYQQFSAAGIELVSGRLDDAAAQFDSALELIESAEMAWTSMAVGPRAEIDVYRGNLTDAEDRLDAFARSGAPNQFGLPEPERARVALLEAQRRYAEAAELGRLVWERAVSNHCYMWLASYAGDFAHVALRAADAALLQQICADLTLVPKPITPACAGSVALATALNAPDPRDMVAGSLDAAALARRVGEGLLEMLALEEAACAAAVVGHKDAARTHARAALALADSAGATTVTARIQSRLRSAGIRLGAKGARRRPQTGWGSLTPTEARIAEMVATGMTGPEVASQLYISPRTVQTHVSHALAKLGLRTRVELAAAAAAR
ncbi:MAG TPA: LuxR C-terminal-related transcriptional regulator, partial [Aldersonia sp.]